MRKNFKFLYDINTLKVCLKIGNMHEKNKHNFHSLVGRNFIVFKYYLQLKTNIFFI